MKFSKRSILVHSFFGAAVLASPTGSPPASNKRNNLPLVDVAKLESDVNLNALMGHAYKLEEFAKEGPVFNRAAGTKAHNKTLDYIISSLEQTNYYNIEIGGFSFVYYEGNATFSTPGVTYQTSDFSYGPASNGTIVADLVHVKNFGCDIVSQFSTLLKLVSVYHTDCVWGLISRKTSPKALKASLP